MSSVEVPWQYSFPPFFTIQPNIDTRKKQLEAWCSLVLDQLKKDKNYSLDVNEAQKSIFSNKEINRKLSLDGIYMVLDELQKRGNLEWKDPKTKKECLVMWRTPEEWGKMIYKYITDKSMTNTVCTLFELSSGDETAGEEFHGIEQWLLIRALKTLENDGKAELMKFGDNEGVKFF
ncbi:Vacuolar protein-sorting-associated protein 25 [Mactra antiquata]